MKHTINTIEEIKTYKCSDGAEFDDRNAAEAHEEELKDPNYVLLKRIEELEKKIQHLEVENLKRIEEISSIKQPFKINQQDNPWLPKVYYRVATNGKNVLDAIDDFFLGTQDKKETKNDR